MNDDESVSRNRGGNGLDLGALATAARRAEGGEAYYEISRDSVHRLGVVASLYPSNCVYYTLECTLCLFSADAGVEPPRLARAARAAQALRDRGYDLAHLDGGWISCEKIVRPEDVPGEADFLLHEVSNDDESPIGGHGPGGARASGVFFARAFFDEVASRLNADPEWHVLADRFSTRVVLTCVDRGASYLLEVVDGRVASREAGPDTVADFRFEAEEAAWIEVMRGQADYYPLVRARRMRFRGSVLRLRLKMAPLDRMTFTAQRVFAEQFQGDGR